MPLRLSPPRVGPGSWSGARLHPSHLGRRCPPSALYTFPARLAQGLARRQLQREPLRAFTEFDGLHLGDFSARAQVVVLSPLRLPIPPLGHRGAPTPAGAPRV